MNSAKPQPGDAQPHASSVDNEDLAKQLASLSQDEADIFVRALELTIKRRRNMLIGYVLSLIAIIFGMVWALYMYGTREPGTFRLWVFCVPPTLSAIVLIAFGRFTRLKRR